MTNERNSSSKPIQRGKKVRVVIEGNSKVSKKQQDRLRTGFRTAPELLKIMHTHTITFTSLLI